MLDNKNIKKLMTSTKNNFMCLTTCNTIIKYYKNNTIIIPTFQREINTEKINDIKDAIKKNNNWLLKIGILEFVTLDNITFYIIDGQHRLTAINELYNESNHNLDHEIYIKINIVANIQEMKELFKDINMNSKIDLIYTYFENEECRQLGIKLFDYLKKYYNKAFRSTTKTLLNTNMSRLEFNALFTPEVITNFVSNLEDKNNLFDQLIAKINECNNAVKNKLNNINSIDINDYINNANIDKSKKYDFYLAHSNIQFINYFTNIDNDLIITKRILPKNRKINRTLKRKIWNKKEINNSFTGKCYICKCNVDYENFHCGHLQSHANGGNISIDNLEIMCRDCNLALGSVNIK